jgi:alkylhydroperoxidase family enzyme
VKGASEMSRLSIPKNDQLAVDLRTQVESIDASGGDSTVLRVLGHRPDMIESYFQFYYPLHNGGIVDPALKELVRLRIASLNQCLT